MSNQDYTIEAYSDQDREALLLVWEESVRATHGFLQPADFTAIKAIVHTIDFNDLEVYCLKQEKQLAGFIGVAAKKIEMLFFSPDYIGKGLGRELTEFALQQLKANKVDVNEQNEKAVEFYKKLGFKTYERTDKDDQGNDYPLLRMQLPTTEFVNLLCILPFLLVY